jgi:membrane protease YdiL (CAAX protease family)
MLFRDVLLLHKSWSYLMMVFISAVLFAAYHYLGNETFQLRSFVFRTVAGVYFGIIFLVRGLGVTAGSHACYDIFATSLRIFAT